MRGGGVVVRGGGVLKHVILSVIWEVLRDMLSLGCVSLEQCHTRVCVHLFTAQMLVMPVFPNYQDIIGLLSSTVLLQYKISDLRRFVLGK